MVAHAFGVVAVSCPNDWYLPEQDRMLCKELAGDCIHEYDQASCPHYPDTMDDIGDIIERGVLPKTPQENSSMEQIKQERCREMTEFWKHKEGR